MKGILIVKRQITCSCGTIFIAKTYHHRHCSLKCKYKFLSGKARSREFKLNNKSYNDSKNCPVCKVVYTRAQKPRTFKRALTCGDIKCIGKFKYRNRKRITLNIYLNPDESKECNYCHEKFYRKDHKHSFDVMITCGGKSCKSKHKKAYSTIFYRRKIKDPEYRKKINDRHNGWYHSTRNRVVEERLKSGLPAIDYYQKENIVFKLLQEIFPNKKIKRRQRGILPNRLELDFYLPEINLAIEYNGIQHYKKVKFFYSSDSFDKRQFNDELKQKYCKKLEIKLIIIRYDEKLSKELILQKIEQQVIA